MSMFDTPDHGDHNDDEVKDQLLRELIEKMEAVLGDGLKQRNGMGVEVQADSPEALKAGLEHAGEVVEHEPAIKSDAEQADSDESDLARLAELDDDDEEKKKH